MKTFKIYILLLASALLTCNSLEAQRIIRNIPKQLTLQPVNIKTAMSIAKAMDLTKLATKPVLLEGYFVSDPEPFLVTDMKWYYINMPMPDSVFVRIQGETAEIMRKNPEKYFGAYVRLRGDLILEKRTSQRGIVIKSPAIRVSAIPELIKAKPITAINPTIYNICKKYPEICKSPTFFSKNYALLYSGGVNSTYAYSRYWNDLKFMYKTLKSKYGYTDERIVVVYKNGIGEDEEMTVDYAASVTGLRNAINYLTPKIFGTASLFFFITNHGGGYSLSDAANYSGVMDAAPLDEIDTYKYDETVFYYNQADNKITDDSLSVNLNKIVKSGTNRLIAVMEPCFSGGLLRDLRGNNRTLVSAANEFEFSWAGAPGNHDLFSYYFTSALNKADHEGNPINADTNGDGKISILEAFLYAKSHDTSSEHPLLEDSGDGVGIATPTATGTDGAFSSNVFL